jgi:hypothetical protein
MSARFAVGPKLIPAQQNAVVSSEHRRVPETHESGVQKRADFGLENFPPAVVRRRRRLTPSWAAFTK